MTLVSLPSPIAFPGIVTSMAGSPSLATATTIDAAGEYFSYVFCAKESMTISHVSFRSGTATGSPEVIVSIEGVVAGTGLPDGAATYGGSASASTVVASNTNPIIALGGSATIAKGDIFAVKIAYNAGTSLIIQHCGSLSNPIQGSLPYLVTNTGTPTKAQMGQMALIALGSSSTVFYQVPGTFPISAVSTNSFNNTSSAKRGLKFTPPMDCRIIGLRFFSSNQVGDFNAAIGDDGGTELSSSSTAFEGDRNAANVNGMTTVYFDNAVTGAAGTIYRAWVEPSSATNVNLSTLTLPSADFFSASPAGATAVYATFVTSTWTDSTTQLPLLDVIIDQVDDGTGTGGGGGGQRVISG